MPQAPIRRRLVLGASLIACAVPAALQAQTPDAQANGYPQRPIKLLVGIGAGSTTDQLARIAARHLSDVLKQPVVVDNRPGAGGNLGVDAAAKAAPDGYTLVMGQTSNLAINPWLYAKLPYDPIKSLAPVALVSSAPIVMAAPANTPYKTFADLVTAAKARPDGITLGY